MSFAVRLSTDLISVEAGANVPLSIEVVNRGEEPDRYELEIEGLDPEWVAVPVPSFPVEARETAVEKAFFKPPRTSESLAGNYPFVAKVRSLNSGEQRTAQGVLQIRPYHHVSMDIGPKKGSISPFRHQNDFTVTLINLGNTEHSLQLSGGDPEEACAFEFEQDHVTVAPGQQKQVEFLVTPTSSSVLASSRLFGFQVTARSMDTPSVTASSQAQLEQRAFLSPSTLVFLVFATLLAGAWLYMMPKPPALEMGVSPDTVMRGESVKLWWRAANANRVTISVGDDVVVDTNDAEGSETYTPGEGGRLIFTGIARRGDKQTGPQEAEVEVNVPVPAPLPRILTFKVNRREVKAGQSVILNYKFNEAVVKATLAPQNQELNLKSDQIEITLTEPGAKTFTVIAENKDGKTVKDTVTVTARDVSLANIIVFRAEPKTLPYPGGLVSLTWQVNNAIRVEISDGSNTTKVDPDGTRDVYLDKTTTFTLTAYDKDGKKIEGTFRIVVEGPPPIPPDATFTPSGPNIDPNTGGPR